MSRGSWIITPSGVIIYKCASPTCQTPGAPPRRYKLRTPAPAYFGTHAATMQRVELCAAAAGAWRARRKVTPAKAAAQAAADLGVDEAEDALDLAFAEAQISALAEARPGHPLLLLLLLLLLCERGGAAPAVPHAAWGCWGSSCAG